MQPALVGNPMLIVLPWPRPEERATSGKTDLMKQEGDTLTFFSESPGQRSRYTYRFESANQYSFKIEGARGGSDWMPFMEASYSRNG